MRDLQITQSITNRETASVELYLAEIGKIGMVGAEEEAELARRAKLGDQQALERLCKVNLRFVVSVAKKYQNQGLPLGDLINEGNMGLIKAAQKFDETKGFKFISYAVWWIRQSILHAIAEHSRMIRLPYNQVGMITQINKAAVELEQQMERQPTAEELADHMDKELWKVNEALYVAPRTASYDAALNQCEDEYSLLDKVKDPEEVPADMLVMEDSAKQVLRQILGTLKPRERRIVELSYGLTGERDLAHADVGEIVGLSPERVRQISKASLTYLRESPLVRALILD